MENVIEIEQESLILNGLNIGTVETGDVASATITGNAPHQTLNLVIPKGEKGDEGDVGPQGPQGIPGPKGADGIVDYNQINSYIDEQIGNTLEASY